ncbi:MAG: TetR/AcrR family transcriptional regulator [Spirochaetes bacterium]|nr:TetR/AcrR family transcriptional regulator [Spirochaetota bacterium]
MTGYEKRTEAKKRIIQRCASELFDKYGFEKVTLEEIASKAKVSRVTIYKYFKDKENLQTEILKNLALQTTESIEKIIQNDLPFPEKFKRIILLKKDISELTNNQFIESTIGNDGELGGVVTIDLIERIAVIMQKFIQQGKKEGFIHPDLTDETVNNYFKLIRAGFKQLQDNSDPLLYDLKKTGELIAIYMNGLKYGADQKLL